MGKGMRQTMPVRWYELIKRMEEFREETGMGLANVWGLVHNENYDGARALFEEIADQVRRGRRDHR